MELSVAINGRTFTIDWKLPAKVIEENRTGVQEFTVRGNCFLLEYSFNGSKMDVKMMKKQPKPVLELSQALTNLNFSSLSAKSLGTMVPHNVTATKKFPIFPSSEQLTMAKSSDDQWGPVSWTCWPQALINPPAPTPALEFNG